MKSARSLGFQSKKTLLALPLLAFCAMPASAQVSPSEVLNPDLQALEQAHFQQLIAINHSVAKTKFPFPFYLSRYVGLDPAKQAEADTRGLEFVRFKDRAILKVSGNYNAAYDTLRLTQNERATATFRSVILPILQVVTAALPEDLPCDGIGFEIAHHARTNNRSYDFEGKETLVVVFDRADAWAISRASSDPERQEILNRSKVFVSGVDYGLSLTERDPLNVETLRRSIPANPDATSSARQARCTSSGRSLARNSSANASGRGPPRRKISIAVERARERRRSEISFRRVRAAYLCAFPRPDRTRDDPEEFAAITPARGSIYKRAAESFDLFLAPLLKDISERISPDVEFELFDFSVLNKLSPTAKETSEAVEFICPRAELKKFVNAEITNQQLLDQSVVLVNGVRIALNLQLVE